MTPGRWRLHSSLRDRARLCLKKKKERKKERKKKRKIKEKETKEQKIILELLYNYKRWNVHIMGIPEGEEREEKENQKKHLRLGTVPHTYNTSSSGGQDWQIV